MNLLIFIVAVLVALSLTVGLSNVQDLLQSNSKADANTGAAGDSGSTGDGVNDSDTEVPEVVLFDPDAVTLDTISNYSNQLETGTSLTFYGSNASIWNVTDDPDYSYDWQKVCEEHSSQIFAEINGNVIYVDDRIYPTDAPATAVCTNFALGSFCATEGYTYYVYYWLRSGEFGRLRSDNWYDPNEMGDQQVYYPFALYDEEGNSYDFTNGFNPEGNLEYELYYGSGVNHDTIVYGGEFTIWIVGVPAESVV